MNNLSGTVEIHEKAPNSMLAVITLGGAVFEQGFDGTTAWSDDPQNGMRVLPAGNWTMRGAKRIFIIRWSCKRIYSEDDSHRNRENQRARYLRGGSVFASKGAPDKMYFDTQNWLLVRSVNHRYTPDGLTEFQADVEEYTEVDGVKLPFTVHQIGAECGVHDKVH